MLGLAAALLVRLFVNPEMEIEARVVASALFPRKNLYTAVDVGRNQPRHLIDKADPPKDDRPMTEIVVLPERLDVKDTPEHPREAKNAEF